MKSVCLSEPCNSACPAGDCAGCAFPPPRSRCARESSLALARRERADNPERRGVRSLEDLRQRCVVEEDTGCWIWKGAMSRSLTRKIAPSPRVWVPDPEILGEGVLMTAGRAAWLMSGRRLETDQVVWRCICNRSECIVPEHGRAATRAEMHAGIAAAGLNRGNPDRAAINLRNSMRMATPAATVREVEAAFAAGSNCKQVRAIFGIAQETTAAIRDGRHVHSSRKPALVPMASVFAFAGAA